MELKLVNGCDWWLGGVLKGFGTTVGEIFMSGEGDKEFERMSKYS